MPGARNYCFTINNPEKLLLFPDGLPPEVKYCVWQLECGAEGTRHLQGYVQFAKQITMAKAHELTFADPEGRQFQPFCHAHMEVAKGKPQQNKDYCTKADTRKDGPWELGTMSGGSGERTDLAAAAKIILDTGDLSKVDPTIIMKHGANCLKLMALAVPPRRDGMKVITIIGDTGIGKSFATHECYPNLYMPFYGNSGLWWDGYTGQEVVLIEEFRGQVPLQKMLQILDPYPLRVEVKGGAIPARYRLVIITSNTQPQDWYPDNPLKPEQTREPERKALLRRLGVGTPRYIVANTRPTLHAALAIALRLEGVTPPVPQPWLGAPMMPAPSATPALSPPLYALDTPRPQWPVSSPIVIPDDSPMGFDDGLEPPPLKRTDHYTLGPNQF